MKISWIPSFESILNSTFFIGMCIFIKIVQMCCIYILTQTYKDTKYLKQKKIINYLRCV